MNPKRKRSLKTAIIVAVLAAIGLLFYEIYHWTTHVYISNAQVQTELITITSRVDGTVEEILINEGERVEKNQPLVTLVADDIKLRIATLETDLALQRAERSRLAAEKAAFESEIGSTLGTKQEEIQAAKVEFRHQQVRLGLAQKEFARINTLFDKKLVSEKALATEKNNVLTLKGRAAGAKARMGIAEKALEEAAAKRKQIAIISEEINISHLTSARIKQQIALARVSLDHRRLHSPISGVIDRVYKYRGEYVEEGEDILILHDRRTFWLEAHVDEGDIRHVQRGQTVSIDFAAHPFKKFLGEVLHIGSATMRTMKISERSAGRFDRRAGALPVRYEAQNYPPEDLKPRDAMIQ